VRCCGHRVEILRRYLLSISNSAPWQTRTSRNAKFKTNIALPQRPLRGCSIQCFKTSSARARSSAVACFRAAAYKSVIQVSCELAASDPSIRYSSISFTRDPDGAVNDLPAPGRTRCAWKEVRTSEQAEAMKELDDVRIAGEAFQLCGAYLVAAALAVSGAGWVLLTRRRAAHGLTAVLLLLAMRTPSYAPRRKAVCREAVERVDPHPALLAMEAQRRARAALAGDRNEAARLLARARPPARDRDRAHPLLAELLGADTDSERAIRWLIALMVLCCDPLAIALTANRVHPSSPSSRFWPMAQPARASSWGAWWRSIASSRSLIWRAAGAVRWNYWAGQQLNIRFQIRQSVIFRCSAGIAELVSQSCHAD
jgi:hypothetical protein